MKGKLNAISLFSGIAGFELALSEYCRTMLYCEKDKHAQAILLSRMAEGKIDIAPICTDVREITAEFIDFPVDIIFGGFPCQDISVAGNGLGLEGKRSGLFFEIARLAKEIKPTFIFLENVPAIRTRGLDRVIEELTKIGYDCRWTMLSAADVGANHKRERWFLLAHSQSIGKLSRVLAYTKLSDSWGRPTVRRLNNQNWRISEKGGTCVQSSNREACSNYSESSSEAMAYTNGTQFQGRRISCGRKQKNTNFSLASWWEVEPNVGRVVDEFPCRVDRLKRIGNAVVPLQAKTAFEYLMGII